jgi:hypothetical protein
MDKKWFESKSILAQILMGVAMIVGVFIPSVGEFIKLHFAELGGGWAILNIVLRVVTKGKVQIL